MCIMSQLTSKMNSKLRSILLDLSVLLAVKCTFFGIKFFYDIIMITFDVNYTNYFGIIFLILAQF